MSRLLHKLKLNCLWLNWEKNWYSKTSSLKRWCIVSFLRSLMSVLTNRNGIKGSVWNPTCLWHEAKEIVVTVRPTTYGKFVLSFSFAVVPFIFSRVLQMCTGHTFYPWKGVGMRKKGDLNFWISSCEDVHTYIILLMPNADYTEEVPALLMLILPVLLNTSLQTSNAFASVQHPLLFTSPSIAAGAAAWRRELCSSSPWLSHSYASLRKPWSRVEQNYSTREAIGSPKILLWDWAIERTVTG